MTNPTRPRGKALTLNRPDEPQPEIELEKVSAKGRPFSPEEASSYIVSMTSEMRNIARGAQFPFLAYLLDMALQEAVQLAVTGGKTPEGPESQSQI
jgi:hypothetical protein